MDHALISLIVYCTKEVGEQSNIKITESLGSETVLFGNQGILDSLGLVNLVVAVEQAIEDHFSVSISLADSRAMSQSRSPFRTIGSLADYAKSLIQEEI
jgi:D-alanine--poly(phosphoribitol) ligase subunit 2